MLIRRRTIDATAQAQLIGNGVVPVMARVFAARGVATVVDLQAQMANLLPPATLRNADVAAEQLADVIANRQRMLIVADYDCDGATACAVGVRAIRAMGGYVEYLVPNRFEYGYGLTPEIVALAAMRTPDVLITVDNGIASVAGVAAANAAGMRVVVTDHHLPGDALPAASVIVNPNQGGDDFGSKHIAGVGVIFYVMLALRAALRARGWFASRTEPNLAELLDLVALGTVADVVKLDANNRILVEQGLRRIRAGRAHPGVAALITVAGRSLARASTYDMGFVAGPRLNAAGRLEDMSLGIECLVTDDIARAESLAQRLDALNRERRGIEADMQQTAFAALGEIGADNAASISLFDPTWHQGVVGIVASRVKEKYYRPTICFARAEPKAGEAPTIKGSGRSIPTLHLRDALDLVTKRHPTLVRAFGGHAAAAGLTIAEADFAAFSAAFEAVCQSLLSAEDLMKVLETDGPLAASDIGYALAKDLAWQVWGQGFAEPKFEGRFTVLDQRIVGEKHTRLWLQVGSTKISGIRFGSADPLPKDVDLVYKLGLNEYRGEETPQIVVEHVG